MTINYHSPTSKPPCTWGLTVSGILFLCAAGIALLNAFGQTASLSWMPAPNRMGGPQLPTVSIERLHSLPQTILILQQYIPAAIWLLICAVGALRRKRWVRPWVLIGCTWFVLEVMAQTPGKALLAWHTVAEYDTPAGNLAVEVGHAVVFFILLAFLPFHYFRKPAMTHSLAIYDPRLSRLDRWPLVVLGTAVIATCAATLWAFESILNCFGLPSPLQRAGLLTNIIGAVNCAIMIIAGLLCLKWPLAGWKLLCLSLTVALIFNLVFHALFPEYYAHLANLDRNPFLTDDPQATNTPVPSWTILVTSLAYSLTFLVPLLLLRHHFHPAQMPPHD
jgi:hypothetical protein